MDLFFWASLELCNIGYNALACRYLKYGYSDVCRHSSCNATME